MRTIVAILSLLVFVTVGYAMDIQEEFDPIGPAVKHFTPEGSNKTLVYIDEGEPDWDVVLFLGGTGTSVRVFGMTEFARTLRTQLKLRVISLERDGFGETEYTAGLEPGLEGTEWQYDDYVNEVAELLDYLGVDAFRGIAISGGGPYLGAIAAAMPDRIVSLHFAAALSFINTWPYCEDWDLTANFIRYSWMATNPIAWWSFGPDAVVRAVPGLVDVAHDDAARTFYIRGQMEDALPDGWAVVAPEVAEWRRYECSVPKDVTGVDAPVYLYYGDADSLYPTHTNYWATEFENIAKIRIYEGEGHDIQYRHWDQILVDIAGMGDKTVLCHNGKSKLLPESTAEKFIERGATLGICAWEQGE
jgi:pimeloyl-ACP methyl ester carboxylesterase